MMSRILALHVAPAACALALTLNPAAADDTNARIEGFKRDMVVLYSEYNEKRVVTLDAKARDALLHAPLTYRGNSYWVTYEGAQYRVKSAFVEITNTKPTVDPCGRTKSSSRKDGSSASGVVCE